jgi:hypothetical protein
MSYLKRLRELRRKAVSVQELPQSEPVLIPVNEQPAPARQPEPVPKADTMGPAAEVGHSHMTVSNWLKKAKKA